MGLFSFFKSQFIEVIEWTETDHQVMVHRFPVRNNEIKMGAQLTVRESQAAVFVNEGQLADIFGPGRYQLSTQNMPILTTLKSWKYGFNSPFKAEVYFVNTRQFTDQKWGTTNPVMMRDKEFGVVRLRSFGNFSFRVADPAVFLREIFGTHASFGTQALAGQLRTMIVSGVSDLLGETQTPAIDLANYYNELSEQARDLLQSKFEALGLQLVSLIVENISLPEEVEKAIDRKSSMGVLGDMNQFAQYQAAEAMREAANNPGGGAAGAGVGMGAGLAMGQMMTQAFQQNTAAPAPQQPAPPAAAAAPAPAQAPASPQNPAPGAMPEIPCGDCGHMLKPTNKFCPECGKPNNPVRFCSGCGHQTKPEAKFCPECGTRL